MIEAFVYSGFINMKIIAFLLSSTFCIAASFNRANFPAYGETRVNSAWTSAALNGINIPSSYLEPDVVGCNNPNDWALTYDDGPGSLTAGVLKDLRDRNIKATFFVVGQQVVDNPDLLRQAYNDGHEIAIHTWSHKSLITLTNDQVIAEIVWTAKAVNDIVGVVPNSIRPPYGAIDNRVRSIIQALGLKIISWNVDTNDWQYAGRSNGETVAGITNVIRSCISGCSSKNANQGGIVLEHDYPNAFAISEVLDTLRSTSFSLRTVSQCVGFQAYSSNWLNKVEGSTSTQILPPPVVVSSTSSTVASYSSTSTTRATSSSTWSPSSSSSAKVYSQSSTSAQSTGGAADNGAANNQDSITTSASLTNSLSSIITFLLVALTIFVYI